MNTLLTCAPQICPVTPSKEVTCAMCCVNTRARTYPHSIVSAVLVVPRRDNKRPRNRAGSRTRCFGAGLASPPPFM
jgi:hypothetical protein